MSQMPIGPSVEAPAPYSPGLAEAGGESGCGTTGDGQWERRQTGVGGVSGVGSSALEGRLDEAEIAANFGLQKRCQG